MKKYIALCAAGLVSCTGNSNQENTTSSSVKEDTTEATTSNTAQQGKLYCFIRVEGTSNQDTTTVNFTVNDNQVEGEMKWVPKEKDSRRGILTGTIAGDEITAVWSYMQEGMQDSITLAFKLSPQQLAQKPLQLDTVTYREKTDKTAGYTVMYEESKRCL